MWETTATLLKNMGGEILIRHKVTNIEIKDNKATSATILDILNNKSFSISCDYLFSSMPVVDLINSINPQPKSNVNLVANGLLYRNFITVGVLLNKLSCFGGVTCENLAEKLPDNWLYIQEENVKLGRIQIFNNWSPYLIADSNTIWVGLEYFCGDDDSLWQMSDDQLKNLAIEEAQVIDFFSSRNVIDMFVARMPKAYPAYFGTYSQMHVIQEFSNKIENLFPIGRNGMHKYNNQDHSMLTAMTAVDNILSGIKSKDNIWAVNTDEAYHEENEP
jgi:protoporphyrinogen oxidase